MVGPADPLDQPLDVLGRTDLDHQINIAPVDAQIERAGTDDRTQRACDHCGLDLFALRARQAAVVNTNWQIVNVGQPEVMKENLGLCAGVVKDQGGLVFPDLFQDGGDRIFGAAPGPGRVFRRYQHGNVGVRSGIGVDDCARCRVAGQFGRHVGRVLDRGRQPDTAQIRGETLQTAERQHELVAAFAFGKGMDFIDDNPLQTVEDARRILIAGQ